MSALSPGTASMTGSSPAHQAWSAVRQEWSETAHKAGAAGDHETAQFAHDVVADMARREPPAPGDPQWMHHLAEACSDSEVWDDELHDEDEELGR